MTYPHTMWVTTDILVHGLTRGKNPRTFPWEALQQIGDFDARVYHECLHLVAAHQGFKEHCDTHVLLMQRRFQALAPLDSFFRNICLTQISIAPCANAACIFPLPVQNVRDWETAPKGHLSWHICHFRTFLRQRNNEKQRETMNCRKAWSLAFLPVLPSTMFAGRKRSPDLSEAQPTQVLILFLSQDFMMFWYVLCLRFLRDMYNATTDR